MRPEKEKDNIGILIRMLSISVELSSQPATPERENNSDI